MTDDQGGKALLEAELRRFCAASGPDTPIVPERRLAARYGITHAAARKVLARLLDEGLIYRHQGRGTFVAKDALAAGACTVINVDTWHRFSHPYYVERLRGIMAEARRHRLRLEIFDGPPFETAEFYREASRPEVCGVILPYASPNLEAELRRAAPRLAIVSTGYATANTTVTHVVIDYRILGAMAADYLLQRGARRPFAICGHREARQAFAETCAAAGVTGETVLVDAAAADQHEAVSRYREHQPDGLAFDDEIAAGTALAELGRVPLPLISEVTKGAPRPAANAALLEVDGHAMGRLVAQTLHAMIHLGLYHNTIVRVRPTLLPPASNGTTSPDRETIP